MNEPFADRMPHVDGVAHEFVYAGGLRVHVASAGPPDGEPVLLVHGWPQHWYEWRGVVPALSERYRLLMPDLRGLGWTDAPASGYEKDNLGRDLVALLDALDIERVKLIAHDWGGLAGFFLCLFAPARVERYLATNIIHPWPRTSGRSLANIWRSSYQLPMIAPLIGPRVTRIPGFVKLFLRAGARGVFTDDELEAFEAPLRQPERARASSRYYRTFQARDLPKLLRGSWRAHRLRVPTLMLHGVDDFAIPPSLLAGYEPYADDLRIELVEGCGHFIVDAKPEIVARRALEFFEAR